MQCNSLDFDGLDDKNQNKHELTGRGSIVTEKDRIQAAKSHLSKIKQNKHKA